MIENINIWATLAAAACAFVLGGAWYTPSLFGNLWLQEIGLSHDLDKKKHGPAIFAWAFVSSLLAAGIFSILVGQSPTLAFSIGMGLTLGCLVATCFGINYLFAQRSLKLFLIDAGYHIAQFILYGVIFGLWN